MRIVGMILGCIGLVASGFLLGRLSASEQPTLLERGVVQPMLVQNEGDPRELLPFPGPGQQPLPGVPEECPLFFFQDGQFFEFGETPFGGGGGSPELFPLEPVPSPLPGQPRPAPSPFDPSFSSLPFPSGDTV